MFKKAIQCIIDITKLRAEQNYVEIKRTLSENDTVV